MAMLIVLLSKGVPPSPYLGRKLFICNDLTVGYRAKILHLNGLRLKYSY